MHSVDLEEFKYGGTNITALRLVDPQNPEVQRVVKEWTNLEPRQGKKVEIQSPELIPVSPLLTFVNIQ